MEKFSCFSPQYRDKWKIPQPITVNSMESFHLSTLLYATRLLIFFSSVWVHFCRARIGVMPIITGTTINTLTGYLVPIILSSITSRLRIDACNAGVFLYILVTHSCLPHLSLRVGARLNFALATHTINTIGID